MRRLHTTLHAQLPSTPVPWPAQCVQQRQGGIRRGRPGWRWLLQRVNSCKTPGHIYEWESKVLRLAFKLMFSSPASFQHSLELPDKHLYRHSGGRRGLKTPHVRATRGDWHGTSTGHPLLDRIHSRSGFQLRPHGAHMAASAAGPDKSSTYFRPTVAAWLHRPCVLDCQQ